jgi:hypothetical protein
MRKVSLLSVVGLLALCHGASAATVWTGEAVVVTADSNCRSATDERRTISKGTVLKSVLRPKQIDDNGADTRISFTHDAGATFIMVLQDTGPNGNYARVGITYSAILIDGGLRSFASFQQVPSNLTANSSFVRLNGQVEDFMFLTGCTVTFRASYSKDQ